jgi:phosphonate transport system substrate-binding protein
MRYCGRLGILIAAFILLEISSVGAADTHKYTFAVPPLMPMITTHANWSPFVERLGRETGLEFELKVYETMDQFEEDIARGTPDFVFLHSVQVVAAKSAQGYIPIVRNSKMVSGSIVVRKDSPIMSVQDLEGKTMAYVGEKNLCRALLDHELRTELQISVKGVYAITASNVLKYVILSKADAGGALDVSFDKLPPELLAQVRVIHSTKKIAPHALIVHPRVPAKVRNSAAEAVLRIASDSGSRPLMTAIPIDSPVRADYDRDYKQLERMNIKRYFGTGN